MYVFVRVSVTQSILHVRMYVCMCACACLSLASTHHLCLSVCLSVCLCPSVWLSVCLCFSLCLSSLSVCLCLSVSVSLSQSLSFSRHHANLRVIVCVRLSFWTMKNYFHFTFMSSNIAMIFTAGDALRLELCKRDLTEELEQLKKELQEKSSQIPHLTEERDVARNERDRLARKSVCLSVCLSVSPFHPPSLSLPPLSSSPPPPPPTSQLLVFLFDALSVMCFSPGADL